MLLHIHKNLVICFEKGIADSLQILYSQQSGQCSENANPTGSSDKTAKTKVISSWYQWQNSTKIVEVYGFTLQFESRKTRSHFPCSFKL